MCKLSIENVYFRKYHSKELETRQTAEHFIPHILFKADQLTRKLVVDFYSWRSLWLRVVQRNSSPYSPLQQNVSVFEIRVCSSAKELRHSHPLRTDFFVFGEDEEVFFWCEWVRADSRAEVREPALFALSRIPAWHLLRDGVPRRRAMLLDKRDKSRVFVLRELWALLYPSRVHGCSLVRLVLHIGKWTQKWSVVNLYSNRFELGNFGTSQNWDLDRPSIFITTNNNCIF